MQPEYKTRDLYEAAYLLTKGMKLARVERSTSSPRCFFVFADFPACRVIVTEYWDGHGLVAPKAYAEAVRSLKDRIFASV